MRNMNWFWALGLVALLSGCGKQSPESSTPKAIGKKFYWVQPMKGHPVHQMTQIGFSEGCKKLGYQVEIIGTDSPDVAGTIALAEQTLAKGDVAGIAIWTGSPSWNPFIEKVSKTGLPIILPHFPVPEGSVLGENGAGKSTLMKILDGVYPTGTFQGEIILAGAPIQLHSPHGAQRKGIGYVPQEIIVIEGLTVAENIFVGHWVDRGILVSFAVRRGEILGIGGLVGSGRSEIVNALYGRLPCSGRIFIEGREVGIRHPRDAKNHGIGLLTEERKQDGLLFNFAIRENVTLHSLASVSRFQVLDRKRETQLANDYKERLAIRAPSVATSVATLSGGNQQKVVLAKVLLPNPKVLLLDEPTKGVDMGAKNEIYKLMMDLVRQGIALVVISSELPELLALCDQFIVLTRGKLADRFAKAEASEHRLMLAATGLAQGRQCSPAGQDLTSPSAS